MSLIAWYPLNGDTKNYASGPFGELENTGETVNTLTNDGKIGRTYTNTSNTSGTLLSTGKMDLGQKQSMFCWLYMTSVFKTQNLNAIMGQHRYNYNSGKGVNMGLTVKYQSDTTGYLSVNTATSTNRTYNTYCSSTLLKTNTWYHVGFTYDGSKINLYVNGQLDGTHNFTGQVTAEDYFGAYMWSLSGAEIGERSVHANHIMKGKLNDIRIYNHTLSKKEVREIYTQPIVSYDFDLDMHFKLRQIESYTPDFTKESLDLLDNSGFNNHGIAKVGTLYDLEKDRLGVAVFNGIDSYCEFQNPKLNPMSDDFSIAFAVKPSSNGKRAVFFGDYTLPGSSGSATGGFNIERTASNELRIYFNGSPDITVSGATITSNSWSHIIITYSKLLKELIVYKDGVNIFSRSNLDIALTKDINTPWRLGRDKRSATDITTSSNTPYYGYMEYFKFYPVTLSEDDCNSLYKTRVQIARNSSLFLEKLVELNEIIENSKNNEEPSKAAIFNSDMTATVNGISEFDLKNKFDSNIYMESDGSMWLKISHQTPNSLFTSTSDFKNSEYVNEDAWFNFEVCNYLKSWEMMIEQKSINDGSGGEPVIVRRPVPNTGTLGSAFINPTFDESTLNTLESITYIPFSDDVEVYPIFLSLTNPDPDNLAGTLFAIFKLKYSDGVYLYIIGTVTDFSTMDIDMICAAYSNYPELVELLGGSDGIYLLLSAFVLPEAMQMPLTPVIDFAGMTIPIGYENDKLVNMISIDSFFNATPLPLPGYAETIYFNTKTTFMDLYMLLMLNEHLLEDAFILVLATDGISKVIVVDLAGILGSSTIVYADLMDNTIIPIAQIIEGDSIETSTIEWYTGQVAWNSELASSIEDLPVVDGNITINVLTAQPLVAPVSTYSLARDAGEASLRKFRWIQNKNPMLSSYTDVNADSIDLIKGNGYIETEYGGIYKKNSNTYLCANDGTESNWNGAIGAWTTESDGTIPGWNGEPIDVDGYIDVYVRIDNADISNIRIDETGTSVSGENFKSFDKGTIYTKNIIER